MTIYEGLCLFGIPTIFLGIFGYIFKVVKKNHEDNEAVKLGIQALLRGQMISDFNKWHDLGYAPIYARENFENCWKQYHALGANGVMDDIHVKFLQLPTEPTEPKGE